MLPKRTIKICIVEETWYTVYECVEVLHTAYYKKYHEFCVNFLVYTEQFYFITTRMLPIPVTVFVFCIFLDLKFWCLMISAGLVLMVFFLVQLPKLWIHC